MQRFGTKLARFQNQDLQPNSLRKSLRYLDPFMYWSSEAWAIYTWTLGNSLISESELNAYEGIIIVLCANFSSQSYFGKRGRHLSTTEDSRFCHVFLSA